MSNARACALLLLVSFGLCAAEPPALEYGSVREATQWIETPGGRVAVDQGVEWQGVKVYLDLMGDLLAVDAKAGKLLWQDMVGAFWNRVGFKEVDNGNGAKVWAVELRPGTGARQGAELVQYHELTTGRKLAQPGAAQPSGQPLEAGQVFSGESGAVAKSFTQLAGSKQEWTALQDLLFGKPDPFTPTSHDKRGNVNARPGDVDFATHVVFTLTRGDSMNCGGARWVEAFEDDRRVLLRLTWNGYQTFRDEVSCRPWAAFVLPRREGKAYVVEENVQRFIASPPIWQETFKLKKLLAAPPEKAP